MAEWSRASDLMQEVVGSNPRLGKIFFTKTDYKSLYREQGTPCTDYRETPVQITVKPPVGITGNPCRDYRESLYRFQGNPCTDYREYLYRLKGNPFRHYREYLYGLQGNPL